MMKKMLIVQPHSDDALFSASHFIFDDKYEIEILTIENNKRRVKEDESLYSFLNIPYHHLGVDFDDQSFYGFHKKYSDVTLENSYEHLSEFFGVEKLKEICQSVTEFIREYLKKNQNVQIVIPWGVGHPFHLYVRDIIEKISMENPLWYYRDFPHSYKRRAANQVKLQLQDFILKTSTPVTDFSDIKWDLARKFYKSQSGLLWFEQGYIKKELPEEVYVRKL